MPTVEKAWGTDKNKSIQDDGNKMNNHIPSSPQFLTKPWKITSSVPLVKMRPFKLEKEKQRTEAGLILSLSSFDISPPFRNKPPDFHLDPLYL